MKTKLILTTALIAALAAANGAFALAESPAVETVYPENFQTEKIFTSLNDYAVSGQKFAFADGYNIYIYENGVISSPESQLSHTVENIEFDGDRIVFKDSANEYYSYAEGKISEVESYDFIKNDYVDQGNYHYYFNDSGLNVLDRAATENATAILGDYTVLKQYANTVYAIKENALYSFDGAVAEKLIFTFNDFSSTKTVAVGQASSLLTKTRECELVRISGDAFITEVDLSDLSGSYFTVYGTQNAADGTLALKLCQTGNATLVAFENKTYLTLTSFTTAVDFTPIAADKAQGVLNIAAGVYSTPYMCQSTLISQLTLGAEVKILSAVSSEVLNADYYLVEYGENGETGYIAAAFITEHSFSDNDGYTDIKDENESVESDIEKIIIVLIIILLVFAVIAYLVHTGSAANGKKKKRGKKDAFKE